MSWIRFPLAIGSSLALLIGLAGEGFAQQGDRALRVQERKASDSRHRVALVIGNAEYRNISALRNPQNDARDMAAALERSGFKVMLLLNGTRKRMNKAIRKFGNELRKGGVGLFFYAGHGVQLDGVNYLIPIGADIRNEDEVEDEAVSANRVMRKMKSAGNDLNMVFLDACRNNPYKGSFRSANRGLAAVMNAPKGSLISYATGAGNVAADGNGRNGTYTKNLLAAINTPNLELSQLMKRVRIGVQRDTNDEQTPYELSSLTGDFYFLGGPAQGGMAKLGPPPSPSIKTVSPPAGNPNSARLMRIARLFLKRGKTERAIEKFRELVKDHGQMPEGIEAQAELILLSIKRSGVTADVEKKEASFRKTHRNHPLALRARRALILALIEKDEFTRAEDHLIEWEGEGGHPEMVAALNKQLGEARENTVGNKIKGAMTFLGESALNLFKQDDPKPGTDTAAALRLKAEDRVWRDPVTGMEFVKVPGGSFEMGCHANAGRCRKDEKPVRTVRLDGFWLGKHEVTVEQFKQFVNDSGYRTKAEKGGGCDTYGVGSGSSQEVNKNWRNPGFPQGDSHPVICVSWNDAQAFSRWLSRKTGRRFHLPSEAQWEFACRAGGKTVRFGTGKDQVSSGDANFGKKNGGTTPVGQYPANSLGLHDMAGNVWELVRDKYTRNYGEVGTRNPIYERSGRGRVRRGGGWVYSPRFLRCSKRGFVYLSTRQNNLGFRLLRSR